MAYLNKVMLIGNIGKDPAIGVSPSGKKRVTFPLATSRRYRDSNGEQKEQTDWHTIVGWGKAAETMEQLGIRKGVTLYVEGALTNRSWTDQATGQKRYATEVSMETFQILTPRGSGNGNAYAGGNGASAGRGAETPSGSNIYAGTGIQAGTQPQGNSYGSADDDDGLPF